MSISPLAPRPVPRPVMLQRWQHLTFLHWRYAAADIRLVLPSILELDTFDGLAWVALTPFLLTDLRIPHMPAIPWISRFPETNVRTYVRGPDGERGVWFFSLEADRLAAVLGARTLYRLPYRWAAMEVSPGADSIDYRSRRNAPFGSGSSEVVIQPGPRIEARDFDNFLTARYRLYTMVGARLAYAQIEHAPWPLQSGRVVRLEQDLFVKSGVPRPKGAPVVHFSRDLEVRIGPLRLMRR